MGYRWDRRRLLRRGATVPSRLIVIQYSARYPDGRRTIYPAEAAYKNDPVWGRSDGAVTESRQVDAVTNAPLSKWTRTYANDPKAIRRQDD